MPKHVSDETFQLSVRIDKRSLQRIDKVRDKLEKDTGTRPQRSDIVRKAIDYGMDVYVKLYKIEVAEPTTAPSEESKVEAVEPQPVTSPEPKKGKRKTASASGGKQARA